MRQRRHRLRLALEPRERGRILRQPFGQDLDRDVAIQLRVAGAVDLAHAARAERGNDFVRTELGTGRERHARRL